AHHGAVRRRGDLLRSVGAAGGLPGPGGPRRSPGRRAPGASRVSSRRAPCHQHRVAPGRSIRGVEEGLDVAALRSELDRVLAPRRDDAPLVVLGGGNDDLQPGRAYLGALAPGGWIAATWPSEFGGRGLTPGDATIVSRELGRYAAPDLYPYLVGLHVVAPTLLAMATPEQCARWLPPIASGA